MKTCPDPTCSAPLEGLGTFCHSCGQYTDQAKEAAPEGKTVGTPGSGARVITLPFPPSANAVWRSIGFMKDGEPAARVVLSSEGRAFKKEAAELLATQRTEIIEGPVSVRITAYFPARRGDLDNRAKPCLDVLQGVAFVNDSQVDHLEIVRKYDKANPRAEVTVEALAPALFTTEELDRTAELEF